MMKNNFSSELNRDTHKRTRLIAFIFLVGVLVGLYFWQKGLLFSSLKTKKPLETLQKIEVADSSIPQEFSDNIPLIPNSRIVETYKYFDTIIQKDTDGVVVLASSKNPEEVRRYYQDQLKPPKYTFVESSDKNDTDSTKILVYSTQKGLVIIKVEKTDTGSKITLRDSNLLVRTQNLE